MELIPRWIRVIIASCLWVILGILLFIPISWADYNRPMNTTPSFAVRRADWQRDGVSLAAIRREVFVVEQHVPEAEEWDAMDAVCHHVIALSDDGAAIGTGRY